MSEPVLELLDIRRRFRQGDRTLDILRGIDLSLSPGELVALVGPSGAGKSTLLQIAGLLEPPTSGSIRIGGQDCGKLGDGQRTRLRRSRIGFVYQFHHLLPEFTALENVAMPAIIAGRPRRAAHGRARDLLDRVGLQDRHDHRPARLSGGEQQRVAIARALTNEPKLLLADEPTGNLDNFTAEEVFGQIVHLVRDSGVAALVATHNIDLARRMSRIAELSGGRIETRPGAA